ncbi:MAG TPA: hypothetical protein PKD33_10180 [Rhodocyclaceae bacterium]|nr:hypothetical protein [Rhodocyclaceae bacterium]
MARIGGAGQGRQQQEGPAWLEQKDDHRIRARRRMDAAQRHHAHDGQRHRQRRGPPVRPGQTQAGQTDGRAQDVAQHHVAWLGEWHLRKAEDQHAAGPERAQYEGGGSAFRQARHHGDGEEAAETGEQDGAHWGRRRQRRGVAAETVQESRHGGTP